MNAAEDWYSNDAATFGDRLAAARDACGLDQKALAQKLGVGLGTIEKWENDLTEPRANKLQMLSGVLNVSIPWLLTGEGDGVEPLIDLETAPELHELMSEMRALRSEMLRSAERMGVLEKRLKQALTVA
ncbi:MAG: helix-turn-helix domain-containing protein [Silicimonas sp.]|nr:helix-turn-helix domain-containing protein [Silicimonas sp.]